MRRMQVYWLVVCVLALATSATAGQVVFKQKVKLPFALQTGSSVLEPGEYLIRVMFDGNNWILSLAPSKKSNTEVFKITGAYADLPKQEQNFQKEYRLQILRMSSTGKSGKSNWIIFNLDWNNPASKLRPYQRWVFRVREAAR